MIFSVMTAPIPPEDKRAPEQCLHAQCVDRLANLFCKFYKRTTIILIAVNDDTVQMERIDDSGSNAGRWHLQDAIDGDGEHAGEGQDRRAIRTQGLRPCHRAWTRAAAAIIIRDLCHVRPAV